MTTLYVDADACPVKAEAEKVATRHNVPMKVVSNGGLRPSRKIKLFNGKLETRLSLYSIYKGTKKLHKLNQKES